MTRMDSDERGVVLVVEDEPDLQKLFVRWLTPVYDVLSADGGEEALATITPAVDVVLLDRRMPDLAGEEVLASIRERDLDCMVAMVSAVDPAVDIVDMEFDDYLTKPVTREELLGTVEQLMHRRCYNDMIQRYLELTGKIGLLMTNHPEDELADHPEFAQLEAEHERLGAQLRATRNSLIEHGASQKLFADL